MIAPQVAAIVVLPVMMLVTSPVLSIVATAGADELHSTDCVISWVELSLNVPVALNCFTAPAGIEELRGAIASETRMALVTVTEAVAETVPETTETVEVPGPTAIASPFWSIVKTLAALEDHNADVNTWVLPSSKLPVAVNCCCVPGATDRLDGVSVID